MLVVSYSWFGQGHVARCLKLANAFSAYTSLEPVLVSGNPEFVRSLEGLPFQTLSIPPYLHADEGHGTGSRDCPLVRSPLAAVPVEQLDRYRGHLLTLLARHGPAAILIDHFPFSGNKSIRACGEMVESVAGEDPPVPIFSGFRGLVSERFLREASSPEILTNALEFLERVFVYLDEEEADQLFDRHPFLQPFRPLFEPVGLVGPGLVPTDPPETDLVLATFGNGAGAGKRIEVLCEAFTLAGDFRPDLHLQVVTGRRLLRSIFEDLVATYASESIEILRHIDLLPRRFSAAELIVCGAGYNTLVEVASLSHGAAISIPDSWSETSEQLQTARRFEASGGIDLVLPAVELEPRRLANRMLAMLEGPPRPRLSLEVGGARQTALRIERLVADRLR